MSMPCLKVCVLDRSSTKVTLNGITLKHCHFLQGTQNGVRRSLLALRSVDLPVNLPIICRSPQKFAPVRLFVCVVHLETNVDLVLITGAETGVNVADMAEAAAIVELVA
jgi:hypothetical protein